MMPFTFSRWGAGSEHRWIAHSQKSGQWKEAGLNRARPCSRRQGTRIRREDWTFSKCWNCMFRRELASQLLPTVTIWVKRHTCNWVYKEMTCLGLLSCVFFLHLWGGRTPLSGQRDMHPLKWLQRATIKIKSDHYKGPHEQRGLPPTVFGTQ